MALIADNRQYRIDDSRHQRLDIGDRVFMRDGSISVFNPLYDIQLTDPVEAKLKNSRYGLAKSSVFLGDKPHETNQELIERSKEYAYSRNNDNIHSSTIFPNRVTLGENEPMTKSMILKTRYHENPTELITQDRLKKQERLDHFYTSTLN